MTNLFEGGCHCGAIRFRYHSPLALEDMPVRECGCSYCVKVRGRYTSHPKGRLEATVAKQTTLSPYRFGTSTADFMVCARCGSAPFVTSRIGDKLYAVLNVNAFDGNPFADRPSPKADFDGEAVEDRLARRQRNWIGEVRVRVLDSEAGD